METIKGTVCRGVGRANRAFTPERTHEVQTLFGLVPYPGTLNLRVASLHVTVEQLGEPFALTEHETRIGPLRWWRTSVLTWSLQPIELQALIVRGAKTRTGYLEIVCSRRLRDVVSTGERLRLIHPSHFASVAATVSGTMLHVSRT